MITLAMETTSAHGSVALLQDETPTAARPLEARQYASSLFGAVNELLAAAGVELAQVDLFAVADGPGSFTGVRIGLSAVKGWIEVLGRPAVAVSTLRAVAGVTSQPVLAVLDASRREVYSGWYPNGTGAAAVFESSDALPDGAGDERLESVAELAARWPALWARRAVTPHPSLQTLLPWLRTVDPVLAPAVGRLGLADFRAGRRKDALELDARYLRRSDAEITRLSQPA